MVIKTVGYFFQNSLDLNEDLKLDGKIMSLELEVSKLFMGQLLLKIQKKKLIDLLIITSLFL